MTTCITSVGWTLERGEETRPPDWQREFKRRPSFSRISKRPNCVGSKVETSPHPSISVQLFNFLGLLVRFLTSSSRRCSVARWPLRFVRALSCLSSINNSGNNKFCWPFFFFVFKFLENKKSCLLAVQITSVRMSQKHKSFINVQLYLSNEMLHFKFKLIWRAEFSWWILFKCPIYITGARVWQKTAL